MFCASCGTANNDASRFCSGCGTPTSVSGPPAVYQPQQPAPHRAPVPSVPPVHYQPIQTVQPVQTVQPAQTVQPVQYQPVQTVQYQPVQYQPLPPPMPYQQPQYPYADPHMRGVAMPGQKRYAIGKNPGVALILSLFFGGLAIGQFYNGDFKKGLLMVAISIFIGLPTAGVVSFGIWIWSIIDAHNVASGKSPLW